MKKGERATHASTYAHPLHILTAAKTVYGFFFSIAQMINRSRSRILKISRERSFEPRKNFSPVYFRQRLPPHEEANVCHWAHFFFFFFVSGSRERCLIDRNATILIMLLLFLLVRLFLKRRGIKRRWGKESVEKNLFLNLYL